MRDKVRNGLVAGGRVYGDLYRGVVVYGRVKRGRKRGTKTRTQADESQWRRREAPELRIVDGVLWDAAHAQIAQKAGAFLRRDGRLCGQVESLRGKYLLSGFLACGVCRGRSSPSIAAGTCAPCTSAR